VKREPDLVIKGMQHNQIQETDWSGSLVLNNDIKYRSSRLTGGSVFTAQKSVVLWFEPSYLQKVILIKSTNWLCNEMVINEFDCLKFELLRRTRMKKRASGVQFPLTFPSPATEMNADPIGQVLREDLTHPDFWVV
jgi:hypothetical protein